MESMRKRNKSSIMLVCVFMLLVVGVTVGVSPENKINLALDIGNTNEYHRQSIREISIIPRRTSSCSLPYGYAVFKGNKKPRHGWEVRIMTLHKCIDCPVDPSCNPGVYSWSAMVNTDGGIIDNEFATIFSAGPTDESDFCGSYDGYKIRWEEAVQLKKPACGKMHTFRIQYPIVIRIEPKELTSYGPTKETGECKSLLLCNSQSNYTITNIYKNDLRNKEIVVQFRDME